MRENQRNMQLGLPAPSPRNQPLNRTLKLSGMLFSPVGLPAQHAKTLRDPAPPQRGEISELLDLSCSDDEATRELPKLSQLRGLRPRQTSLPPPPQMPGFEDSDTTAVMAPYELPDFASPPIVARLNGLPDLSPRRDTPPDLLAWSRPPQSAPVRKRTPPKPSTMLERLSRRELTTLEVAAGVVALFVIAFIGGFGLLAATESTRFVPHAAVPVTEDGQPIQAAPARTYHAPRAVLIATAAPEPTGEVLSLEDLPLAEPEATADDAPSATKAKKPPRRRYRAWRARLKKSARRGMQRPIPPEWKSGKGKNAKR